MIAGYRRAEGNRQFFTTVERSKENECSEESESRDSAMTTPRRRRKFRTSGNVVVVVGLVTVVAYGMLLWLVMRLQY